MNSIYIPSVDHNQFLAIEDNKFVVKANGDINSDHSLREVIDFVYDESVKHGKVDMDGPGCRFLLEKIAEYREEQPFKAKCKKIFDKIDWIMCSLAKDHGALEYVSEALRNEKALVLEAVSKDGLALLHASLELQVDRDLIIAALKALKSEPEHYKYRKIFTFFSAFGDNRDVMLFAVKFDGNLLQYGSPRLQDDREIILEAVRENPEAIMHDIGVLKGEAGELPHYNKERLEDLIPYLLEGLKNQPERLALCRLVEERFPELHSKMKLTQPVWKSASSDFTFE